MIVPTQLKIRNTLTVNDVSAEDSSSVAAEYLFESTSGRFDNFAQYASYANGSVSSMTVNEDSAASTSDVGSTDSLTAGDDSSDSVAVLDEKANSTTLEDDSNETVAATEDRNDSTWPEDFTSSDNSVTGIIDFGDSFAGSEESLSITAAISNSVDSAAAANDLE